MRLQGNQDNSAELARSPRPWPRSSFVHMSTLMLCRLKALLKLSHTHIRTCVQGNQDNSTVLAQSPMSLSLAKVTVHSAPSLALLVPDIML